MGTKINHTGQIKAQKEQNHFTSIIHFTVLAVFIFIFFHSYKITNYDCLESNVEFSDFASDQYGVGLLVRSCPMQFALMTEILVLLDLVSQNLAQLVKSRLFTAPKLPSISVGWPRHTHTPFSTTTPEAIASSPAWRR